MARYSIVVADDQPANVNLLFERLFCGDESFAWRLVSGWSEFSSLPLKNLDAVLLDVNLDDWGKTLREALQVIGGQCPVVLVSQYWGQSTTHQRIGDALAEAKRVPFIGTLVLNDLGRDGWEQHAASMRSQLRLAIARHRQQGSLEIGDDDPLRILHLSDPQYGDPDEENLAFMVEREIPKFIMERLDLSVHFIAVTGDITYSGQPEEFSVAETKLRRLVEDFLPSREDWRERLLFVPGNHDVDLRVAAADAIGYSFGTAEPLSA